MKDFFKIFFIIIAISGVEMNANSTTSRTSIQSSSETIKRAIERYATQHSNAIPPNWEELDIFLRSLEAPNESSPTRSSVFTALDERLESPVEKSFLLVESDTVKMLTPNLNENFRGGFVISVSTFPVSEDRRDDTGRYVIWRDEGGAFRSSWLSETTVRGQFTKAGLNLPQGPKRSQSSTFDVYISQQLSEFAERNFVNPESPTEDELKLLHEFIRQRDSIESSSIASGESVTERISTFNLENSDLIKSRESRQKVANERKRGRHLLAYVSAAFVIFGIVFVLLRFKKI